MNDNVKSPDMNSPDFASFDELARQVIVTTPQLWTEFADAPDQNLIDRTITRLVSPTRRGRWSRLHTFIAALLVSGAVVGGGFAAADLWRTEPAQPVSGMICSTPEDSGFGNLVYPPSADPVAACREAYVLLGITDFDGVPASEVTLNACITKTGVTQVFADTEDVCSRLGLAYPAKEQSTRTRKLAELQESLIEKIEYSCLIQDDAEEIATAEISRLGLTDLRVYQREPIQLFRCSTAIVDTSANEVIITSIPKDSNRDKMVTVLWTQVNLRCVSLEIAHKKAQDLIRQLSITDMRVLPLADHRPDDCAFVVVYDFGGTVTIQNSRREDIEIYEVNP